MDETRESDSEEAVPYNTVVVDLSLPNINVDIVYSDEEDHEMVAETEEKDLLTYSKPKRARRGLISDLLPHEAPFECPFPTCNTVCVSRFKLRRHYRNHQERKHACKFCEQKFLYLKDKRIHERTHTGERPFVCQVCDKAFVQKCTLANHLITHNKTVKDEICDQCGKAYYYKKSLAQHKKEKHSSMPQVYVCSFCGKKYQGRSGYGTHLRKCSKADTVFHPCNDCGKLYQRTDTLDKHKLTCTGRIYQCGVCNKTLSTEDNLSKHMLKMHSVNYADCIHFHVGGKGSEQDSAQSQIRQTAAGAFNSNDS